MEDLCVVRPAREHVTQKVWPYVEQHLRLRHRSSVNAATDLVGLLRGGLGQSLQFLLAVDANRSEKPREPDEAASGVAEANEQVPIEDALQSVVQRTGLLP